MWEPGGRHQPKKQSPAPIQEFQELKPIWLHVTPQQCHTSKVDSSDFGWSHTWLHGLTQYIVGLEATCGFIEIREVNFLLLSIWPWSCLWLQCELEESTQNPSWRLFFGLMALPVYILSTWFGREVKGIPIHNSWFWGIGPPLLLSFRVRSNTVSVFAFDW